MTRNLIGGGVILALILGAGLYGFNLGSNHVQAKWDAAEGRALGRAVDARKAAEDAVPDVAPVGKPCRMRDLYDRDC